MWLLPSKTFPNKRVLYIKGGNLTYTSLTVCIITMENGENMTADHEMLLSRHQRRDVLSTVGNFVPGSFTAVVWL